MPTTEAILDGADPSRALSGRWKQRAASALGSTVEGLPGGMTPQKTSGREGNRAVDA
jgi:hypothetical protein